MSIRFSRPRKHAKVIVHPRGTKVATIAKRALRLAKQNRTEEFTRNAEEEVFFNPGGAPDVIYLQPPQVESIPGKCTYKRLSGSALIQAAMPITINNPISWRFDIILDRTPSGVILSLTNVYNTVTPRTTETLSLNFKHRYKLLYSARGYMTENVNDGGFRKFDIPLNLKAESAAITFETANIQKNAIYLVFWALGEENTAFYSFDSDLTTVTA